MLLHGVLHMVAQVAHTPAESQHADTTAGVIPVCCLHLERGSNAEAVLLKIGQCCMSAGRLQALCMINCSMIVASKLCRGRCDNEDSFCEAAVQV